MAEEQKTILVVEDESAFTKVIQRSLENRGFAVDLANTIDAAVEKLAAKQYDGLWIDHYLPRGTGLDLIGKLRKDQKYDSIPIFLVSNTADATEVYNYIELGVQKYYVKAEHRLDEIVDEISRVVKKPSEIPQ